MVDTIIQEAFRVPEEIAVQIASGECVRRGGTVRDLQGHIVKHLDPIDPMEVLDEAMEGLVESVGSIQEHKTESIVMAIGAGVLAIGVAVYFAVRKYETKAIKTLRASLAAYVDSVRDDRVTLDIVDDLSGAIEAAKKHRAYKKLHIDLTIEEIELLTKAVAQNTSLSAIEAVPDVESEEDVSNQVLIFDLEKHLSLQRSLLAA